ncbi:MAG: DUF domain-containing protein, partial [Sphingobacteriaceae bacterium]
MEVADAENYLDEQKKRWVKYGCTILTDGWTGPTRLSIINIMVYCA